MQNTPVLEYMIQTCNDILQDKIKLLTAALALQGKVRRVVGYDPLVGALTQLAIVSRKMNALEFDMTIWKTAVDAANDRWWEWYDHTPTCLQIPFEAMNYSPRRDDREAMRERLRKLAYSLPMPVKVIDP